MQVLGSCVHLDLSGLAICGPREILFTHDEGRKEFHCTLNPAVLLTPRSICSMSALDVAVVPNADAADTDLEATI